MNRIISLLALVVAGLAGTALAGPTYSGSLSTADGLVAGGPGAAWTLPSTQPPTLTWTVTETTPGLWHYTYTLTVPVCGIGRMIVEASDSTPGPAFGQGDLQSAALSPWPGIGSLSVGNHSVSPENPGMPEAVWGIQADMISLMTTLTLNFDSSRRPVWGDFYARTRGFYCCASGEYTTPLLNWVYNRGFTAGDTDPTDAAANGSVLNHLLVPDSTPRIPAPGAIFLCGLGLVVGSRLRRRAWL